MTKEQEEAVQRAALAVWSEIGGDCMEMAEDGRMSRTEVIEMVADAGRLEERLAWRMRDDTRRHGRSVVDAELIEAVRRMGPDEIESTLKPAFREAWYV